MPGDASSLETPGLHDHWLWRPEWACDRACLWWYLTFENDPTLWSLSHDIRRLLRDVDTVDVVPWQWLHLTLQDVGFVDEVRSADVDAVVLSAARTATDCPPLRLTLGPVTTMRDAVVLAVRPVDDLVALRAALRAAVATVGADPVVDQEPFWPHVSLAYVNRHCDRSLVMDRLGAMSSRTTDVTVPQLTLAAVTRKQRHYQWTARATVALAAPTT